MRYQPEAEAHVAEYSQPLVKSAGPSNALLLMHADRPEVECQVSLPIHGDWIRGDT